MKRKNANTLVYLIFFFVIFLAFCSFAIDATIIFSQRAKLQSATESTALAAASGFNHQIDSTFAEIKDKADNSFDMWKYNNLKTAEINVEVNINQKEVLITSKMLAQPYFLAFLGVSGIELNAVSCAKSEALLITSHYAGINWVTKSMAYRTDVISKTGNYNDTAILQPIGKMESASLDSVLNLPKFDLLDTANGHPLSLGPGGFLTIKLPNPIIDKPGADILIKEIGDAKEGYFVFVGLDVNPSNPYIQFDRPGDGLKWENITCSGEPMNNNGLKPREISTINLGSQVKFYGSAYFDIGDPCSDSGGLSMAKYLRIIDDNDESAFVENGGSLYPAMLYGEASTPTSGADIDFIKLLNHVQLKDPKEFIP